MRLIGGTALAFAMLTVMAGPVRADLPVRGCPPDGLAQARQEVLDQCCAATGKAYQACVLRVATDCLRAQMITNDCRRPLVSWSGRACTPPRTGTVCCLQAWGKMKPAFKRDEAACLRVAGACVSSSTTIDATTCVDAKPPAKPGTCESRAGL
jgi:hypothetical protein